MKFLRTTLVAIAVLAISVAAAQASDLTIRLVEANNSGKADSPELADVAAILHKNLQYKTFILLGTSAVTLPARKVSVTLGSFTITCNGEEKSLSITVTKDGKKALDTTVTLYKKTPLILGGFSAGSGKYVLVFTCN